MKDAPFNITTVLLAVLGAGLVAGGIWGAILNAMGMTGFWGICLAGFLTVPLGSLIRQGTASSAASLSGASGSSPMAFSLPVRLAIGAVVAAGIAYLFSLSEFYRFGFLMGAVAGLLVQTCLILIFYIAVASRK
ncbi:MAG: hypothetical protein AAFQ58_09990 [Pseudomonadota bacterium]